MYGNEQEEVKEEIFRPYTGEVEEIYQIGLEEKCSYVKQENGYLVTAAKEKETPIGQVFCLQVK